MLPIKIDDIYTAINMSNEEWATATSAPIMLAGLYLQDPARFKSFTPVLHRYFLACCWKIKDFIPQQGLRDGLRGASKWIDGEITDKEFWQLAWDAEGEAFLFDDIDTPEETARVQTLINGVEKLKAVPYDLSLQVLSEAAYFTEGAIVYPSTSDVPFVETLCTSRFLCPDLLREFLEPRFPEKPNKSTLDIVAKTRDSQG